MMLVSPAMNAALREARFDGDAPLDRAGERSARAAASAVPKAGPVLSGPSERCLGTAAALGLTATPEPALTGWDLGRWSGRRLDEVGAAEPSAVAAWLGDPSAAPHGGESLRELVERVGRWLDGTVGGEAPGGSTEVPGGGGASGSTKVPSRTETSSDAQVPGGTETSSDAQVPGGTETSGGAQVPGGRETPDSTERLGGVLGPGGGSLLAVAEPAVVRSAVVHALALPLEAFWRLDVAPLALTELSGRAGRWNVRLGRPLTASRDS
ncbi:histidine phosphatase family protein [Streptomyces griseus]|uniref:Histidine phosphatase family protein n=2 Tax=Streptomyces stephensoniae TaxID=3375367 RepID=A0ABU2WBR6_9ACTN|nr:histidine phosphatase family protein [Streptomyces griseus]MDT0494724.1 histidine phosphatase family protein [Streptomyces griseus]